MIPRCSIINCVSEAYEMLRYSSEKIIENAGTDNFDYIIVCWNSPENIRNYMENLQHRYGNTHPNLKVFTVNHIVNNKVGYVPNLRQMINEGFETGFNLNEYAGLTNTDQSFYKDWLVNLLKYAEESKIITSRLIEAGITNHIRKDFGLTEYGKFDQKGFDAECEKIIEPNKKFTEKDKPFNKLESIPYIFHKRTWEICGPWELTLDLGTPDVRFFERVHNMGVEFEMSLDSVAYHVGGVERGAACKQMPKFAIGMNYE